MIGLSAMRQPLPNVMGRGWRFKPPMMFWSVHNTVHGMLSVTYT